MTWALPEAGTLTRWVYRAQGTSVWIENQTSQFSSVDRVSLSGLAPGTYEYKLLMATPTKVEPTHQAGGTFTVAQPVNTTTIAVQHIGSVLADYSPVNGYPYVWWEMPPANTLTLWRYRRVGTGEWTNATSWGDATSPVNVRTLPEYGAQYIDLYELGLTAGDYEFDLWEAQSGAALPTHRAAGTFTYYGLGVKPTLSSPPVYSLLVEVAPYTPAPTFTNIAGNSLVIETLTGATLVSTVQGGTMIIATPRPRPDLQNTTPPYVAGIRFVLSGVNESQGDTQLAPQQSLRPVLTQELDRWGNVNEVTDPRNAAWKTTYRYNADNQLVEQIQPTEAGGQGPRTQLFYDALGRQVGTIDARGYANSQRYDAGGNLVEERHADGGVMRHRYDVFGDKVRTINARDQVTEYRYDKLGQLLQTTRAAVQSYQVNHAVDGSPGGSLWVSEDGAAGQLTETYTYDELGNQITSTNGAGETTRYLVDLRGDIVTTITPLNHRTAAAWDSQHRKIAELLSNGKTATWKYDYFGQLQNHRDQGGATFTYTYDQARQLVQQSSTGGQRVEFDYDAAGQLVEERSYVGTQAGQAGGSASEVWNTSRHTYDAAGYRIREKVTQTTSLDDGRWVDAIYQDNYLAYDALGRLRRVEDGRAVVNMDYDEVGNRTRIQTHVILGASDVRDEDRYFRYDAMNRQTHVDVDAVGGLGNKGHVITYDLEGNRTTDASATLIDGQVAYRTDVYTYDAQQRLVDATRDGKVIDRRYYDKAGRVVENMAADGTEVRTSRYDGNGSLFQQRVYGRTVETGAVTNKYDVNYTSYDNSGNVLSYQVWSFGSPMVSTTYTNTYQFFDSARQASQHATSNPESNLQDGRTEWDYDKSGYLLGTRDLTKPENNRVFVNDARGNALYSSQGGHVQRQLIVNGEVLGRYGEARQGTQFQNVADFNFSYQAVDGNYPATAPTEYMVGAGNTLQSIAKAVYGDSRLWYLIAEANGLASDADLQAGQSLRIPPVVGTKYNSATDFKPYDPSQVIGDTTPHQIYVPPKRKRSLFGQLLAIVIAVIVTVYTAGALSAGFGGGFSSIMSAGVEALGAGISGGAVGLTGTTTLAGGGLSLGATGFAVTGAVGSVASQLVSVAAGVQDRFSWKSVALSALSAGIGAGMGGVNFTGGALDSFGNVIARAAAGNALTQGVGIATGLQRSFNWVGVAAAAAGAGVGQAVGSALGPNVPFDGMGPVQPAAFSNMGFAGDVLRGGISAFAGGLTTAVMRGGRISVAQIATDAFGNALGSSIAESSTSAPATQGVGPYSAADYRNGMDIESDNAASWREHVARVGAMPGNGMSGDALSSIGKAYDTAFGPGTTDAAARLDPPTPVGGTGLKLGGGLGLYAIGAPLSRLAGSESSRSDSWRASDQAYYDRSIANADNPITAVAASFGRIFNNAGHDVIDLGAGLYSLATDGGARAQAMGRLDNMLEGFNGNPLHLAASTFQAGDNYGQNTSPTQAAEDVLRFGAGGLATAGIGRGATVLGGVALDGASATGQWLAPKAAQMAESYLARTWSLAYAVPPQLKAGMIFEDAGVARASVEAFQENLAVRRLSLSAIADDGSVLRGRTVLDLAGVRADTGTLGALEFKLGQNSPLTQRQVEHFGPLMTNGGIVRGENGLRIGLQPGMRISPLDINRINGLALPKATDWWKK